MFRMIFHPSSVQVTEHASGCDINIRKIQWYGKYIANYNVTINVEHITNYNQTRNIENKTNYGMTKIKKKTEQRIYTDRHTKLNSQ